MLGVLQKYRYLLMGESRLRWAGVLMLALVVTAVEALGALWVFFLVGLVASPGGPIEIPLIGDVSNSQGVLDRNAFIVWAAAALAIFFVARAVLIVGQIYIGDRLAHNAGARLSVRLVAGYLRMPYIHHLNRNSAELIRNANESVRAITSEVIIPSVRLVSHAVLAIGMISVLFLAAPLAAAMALVFLGPLVVLLMRVIQPRIKTLGRVRQVESRESLKILQQSLHGIRDVMLLGRQSFFIQQYRARRRAGARVAYLNRVAQELPPVLVETVLILFIAAFLALTMAVQRTPQEGLAVLGLFAYAALRLQPSVNKIVQSLNSIKFAGAAIDNVYDDLVMAEGANSLDHAGRSITPGRQVKLAETLRLEKVEFRYGPDHPPALKDVNLCIHAGESIGIVGPTGGGKSTLLDVLTGLLDPTAGRVLVDGVDVRGSKWAWQRRLGVVSQTVFLLDDELLHNIALGVPDPEIEWERLRAAVELAQLGDFVEALPQGLRTPVGERGVRLSGGQRQRVAIARALYNAPEVLVFDEGTSALDNVTESTLVNALDELAGRHTIIMVAHRLTSVRRCKRIFVVEGGHVTDSGSYEELMARSGRFREIAGVEA